MLIILPLIYLSAFLFSLKELLSGRKQGVFLFFIFGLSIYPTTLSILFVFGLNDLIPYLQPFKEIIVVLTLGIYLWNHRGDFKIHTVDRLIALFLSLTVLYTIMPLGSYSLGERLSALKSMSFFTVVYACGRLLPASEFYLSKNFKYILLITIAAAGVSILETLFDQHLQTITGYAEYNFYMYDQEPSGNYGLTWTFETTGFKRFASLFSNPLEHAAATILAISAIAGLYTDDENRFKPDVYGKLALVASQISVFLALSRASFVAYFMVIYVYAFITKKKTILRLFYIGLGLAVVYFLYFITNTDLYDFVVDTITFENGSSVGHIIEWVAGIESMISNPLGLGMGSSGKISIQTGDNVGGENQFIIIGVQTGVPGFLIYLFLQIAMIYFPFKWFNRLKAKEKKLALTLFLMKVGSIIPLMTSEFESYTYLSYVTWFLSGLFIGILSKKHQDQIVTAL